MHDDQFTAKGPPFPSGFEKAAFSTEPQDNTQFAWGVRVLALRCGVVGQTRAGGVAGVYADGRFSQFGVLGTAFGQRIGVVGAIGDNNMRPHEPRCAAGERQPRFIRNWLRHRCLRQKWLRLSVSTG